MFTFIEALPPAEITVLDLAAGPGAISQRLLRRFPNARSVAVDVDPVLLAVGQSVLGDADGRLRWVRCRSHPDAEIYRDAPTTITSEDLAERFGQGPAGVVWPVSEQPDESIWVLLSIGYLATGLAMLVLARRLRHAGVVVLLLRR